MTGDRFLLDTFYIQALISDRDPYHNEAIAFLPKVEQARELWVTEAVLIEVGNALGASLRLVTAGFIAQCYKTPNMHVVSVDTSLLRKSLDLYRSRLDKDWGLTDCISFVIMQEQGLTDAITADRHFIQAGFTALLAAQ